MCHVEKENIFLWALFTAHYNSSTVRREQTVMNLTKKKISSQNIFSGGILEVYACPEKIQIVLDNV